MTPDNKEFANVKIEKEAISRSDLSFWYPPIKTVFRNTAFCR